MAYAVNERSSAKYTAYLKDETDTIITVSSTSQASGLATLKLTLYDWETKGIINSRTKQDAFNANNVTLSTAGLLTWSVQPLDNVIVAPAQAVTPVPGDELHRALFEYTYGTAASQRGYHEVDILVTNLALASSS